MARKKAEVRMVSYGIYTAFEAEGKNLPKILEFTTDIPARVGVEFGYILNIRKARGEKLDFVIEHPPFLDDSGEVAPPFTGQVYVRSSDYNFFLGDTVWAPPEDKIGLWTPITSLHGRVIATKTFRLSGLA